MVHNSKLHIQNLIGFIGDACECSSTFYKVSSVKQDGTVFVRFHSSPHEPAAFFVQQFARAMTAAGKSYTRSSEVQFRLDVSQF